MRGRNSLLVSVVAVAAVLMLATSPASAGDDASDLAARVQSWQAAFNGGDAGAVAALYTEDSMRMPYQAPPLMGRSEIAAYIQANYEAGATKIELTVGGTESQGNMAWGHGTYHLMDDAGGTVQQGKWMNVSKKVGGQWMIHCDIWNTNAPE